MVTGESIVAEIRATRERIAAECDYDFQKNARACRKNTAQWKGRVVTKEELRRERPPRGM